MKELPMEIEASGRAVSSVLSWVRSFPTGGAILVAAGLLSLALIYAAEGQRYALLDGELSPIVRIDQRTGEVAACTLQELRGPGTGLSVDCSGGSSGAKTAGQ